MTPMKRARQWLFNSVAVISLLLCLAINAMWVVSFKHGSAVSYANRPHSSPQKIRWIYASHGRIWFGYGENFASVLGMTYQWTTLDSHAVICTHNFAGFGYTRFGELHQMSGIVVPYWFVSLATASTPLIWMYRRKTLTRGEPGCCNICGYDLRATPDRCPECGTVPVKGQPT
jgi:hypothetical protein